MRHRDSVALLTVNNGSRQDCRRTTVTELARSNRCLLRCLAKKSSENVGGCRSRWKSVSVVTSQVLGALKQAAWEEYLAGLFLLISNACNMPLPLTTQGKCSAKR